MNKYPLIFRIIWTFNALIAALSVLFYFFVVVGSGSSPYNAPQWLWAFAWAALVLWGSKKLMLQNRNGFAWLLLASLALPCILLLIFIIVLANSNLHWQ
jgi:hypothetical protein